MTIQIQTSSGPVAMTEAEKLELLQAAGAAPVDHLVAADPHPGKFAALDHGHTGLMTTGQSSKLDALPTAAELGDSQAAQDLAINGKADGGHTHALLMTQPERDKLGGVADGATANAADAALRDRATHTGVQAIGTVDGLQAALDAKVDASKIGAASGVAELDSTGKLKASQIPTSALVDVSATGMTLEAGVLTLTQDDGGPSATVDLNSFATDAELTAGLAGKASIAQGVKADTALQPGVLPVGTTLPAAQISDAGAAGRDLLKMATLAQIQASVSVDQIPTLDGRHDFSGTLLSSAVAGSTYNSFPHAVKFAGKMIVVSRQSGSHLGAIGTLKLTVGTPDAGFSTTAVPTVGLPATQDPRDPSLYVEGGTLYLTYFTVTTAGSLQGSYIQSSVDGGVTWTAVSQISSAYAVCGPIQKIGSEYLMPAYKNPTPNWVSLVVRASTPAGPWSEKAVIAVASNDLTEIGFVQMPGSTRLLATIRNESGTHSTMVSVSDDVGTTWTAPTAVKTGTANYDGWPQPFISKGGAIYIIGRRNGSLMGMLCLIDIANPALAASWVEPSWLSTYMIGMAGTTLGSGRCTVVAVGGVTYVIYYTEVNATTANISLGIFDVEDALRKDFSRKDAYESITNGTGLTSTFTTPTVCYVYSLGGLYEIKFDFMTYYTGTGAPYRVTVSIDGAVSLTSPSDLGMYIGELGPVGSAHMRNRSTVRFLAKGWHTIELVAGVDTGGSRFFGGRSLRVSPFI